MDNPFFRSGPDYFCELAEGVVGFDRNVMTFWHCGQRTLSDVLPRRTASGIRMAF
jgi:hypothetical protein